MRTILWKSKKQSQIRYFIESIRSDQEGLSARSAMAKMGFIASFLAAFMTLDGHFFNGETTRTVLEGLSLTADAAQTQIMRAARRL
jgi:hypothetical protein